MSARFDQELGGFVAYQDNGDGTFSPSVQAHVLTDAFFESTIPAGQSTFTAALTQNGPGWVNFLSLFVGATTSAGQVVAAWRLFNGSTPSGRLLEVTSLTTLTGLATACRFWLPSGWSLQLWALNTDTVGRNLFGVALLG